MYRAAPAVWLVEQSVWQITLTFAASNLCVFVAYLDGCYMDHRAGVFAPRCCMMAWPRYGQHRIMSLARVSYA